MASFTVFPGKRYRATIRLGLFESALASAPTIMGKLVDAGFSDVKVWGGGRNWFAEGTWTLSPRSADLPSQITFVEPLPDNLQ
jgi:hypothetical protein